jgi:SSS family solute:Na+ symporter
MTDRIQDSMRTLRSSTAFSRVTFCILALLFALALSPAMSLAEDVAPNATPAGEIAEQAGAATGGMETLDWIVIGAYFALLFGVAWWVIRKNKDTSDDYFLAGRNLGWFVIGASIFASNIGSEHLVGLAGSGCTNGVAMAHYELHAWCLLVLGWVLIPFYMRSKVFTMPEFLERRFNPTSRWVLSMISLVAYVITKIAVGIFAGGIVFSVLLPEMRLGPLDAFWIGSILVIVLTGIYTILGGLRAVVYTEALQSVILVVGSVLVTIYGLQALGGWEELRATLGSEAFNLWKPIVPEGATATWAPVNNYDEVNKTGEMAWYFNGNFPWVSMLFCAPVIGLWYWCTDQYIVQRALGAPNEREARRGSIFASMLKLLPVFIFIIPGMICFALALKGLDVAEAKLSDGQRAAIVAKSESDETFTPQAVQTIGGESLTRAEANKVFLASSVLAESIGKAPVDGEAAKADTNKAQGAFPLLVVTILPAGVRGIVVAGLLAALMSSLAGVFNASATLFTMDFYSRLRPKTSEHQLVWIGRIATVAMVLIGLAWIPVIQGSQGLYSYLQGVQSYLAPPIFVVFFFGIFWKRLNGPGCLASMLVGFAMGLFRLAIDTPVALFQHKYAEGSFCWIMNSMFFQYYSILILIVCVITMVSVSYMTEKPDYEKISGLTFGTLSKDDREKSRESWNWLDVTASAAVLAAIVAAYLYFIG